MGNSALKDKGKIRGSPIIRKIGQSKIEIELSNQNVIYVFQEDNRYDFVLAAISEKSKLSNSYEKDKSKLENGIIISVLKVREIPTEIDKKERCDKDDASCYLNTNCYMFMFKMKLKNDTVSFCDYYSTFSQSFIPNEQQSDLKITALAFEQFLDAIIALLSNKIKASCTIGTVVQCKMLREKLKERFKFNEVTDSMNMLQRRIEPDPKRKTFQQIIQDLNSGQQIDITNGIKAFINNRH